jgi:hypothetical protein
MNLRTVNTIRYVTPLREGGSLPAIVEADDDGTYVLKFRGAGQGARALIADLIVGEMARFLGLRIPEIVFVEVDSELARTEPDPEIQDLIKASIGLNLALDYLPGSITFDPLIAQAAIDEPSLASKIVWLDAYTTNVDRTARNTNMLVWHKNLWLIDHGAALYFHHSWDNYLERSNNAFPQIKEHVLLPFADKLADVDVEMTRQLTPEVIAAIVDLIPDSWLGDVAQFASTNEHRAAYVQYLVKRLAESRSFVEEAQNARSLRV